ncbi:MAG: DUF4159 domain-containing protein [Candidatus Zixiibacteriota bacterium]
MVLLKTAMLCLVMATLIPLQPAMAQREARRRIGGPQVGQVLKGSNPDPSAVKVARLHYSGGGDWYWGGSAIPNFLKFVQDNSDYPVDTLEQTVAIMDAELFQYPFLFATGHGVIAFSGEEKERLRRYLLGGGFLFVNDSYGMARTFQKEMASLFPERKVVEIPFDHPLYHCFYDFPNGPPKIHEHDGNPPRGYGLIVNGRLAVYFLVESDIGDGWEDSHVHNDPPEKREQAFKMGLNILTYALLF